MQLLNFLLIAAAHAASDKDKVPVPCDLSPAFTSKLYSVAVDEDHYEHGDILYPEKKGDWDVTLSLVPDADTRRIRADYPLVEEVLDMCVEVVEPFVPVEEEFNKAKTFGDSTVFMTFSIEDRAVTQFYTGQKRLGVICETHYVGTISNPLVVEPLFAPGAEVFKFNCGVVSWEDANYVEALSYRALMTTLGKRRRHLCMQMPVGWVARFGLHPRQIAYIESKPDGHALKRFVLPVKDGGRMTLRSPLGPGRMEDPERRASHTALISAGLLEHGWDVEEGGTLFKPGNDIGIRFETGNANYMNSVAAMPKVYAPTYMLIVNIAFGCASLPYENQDECIPDWLSDTGVVTKRVLRKPQFKAPFEFEVGGESYRVVGANVRLTLPRTPSPERYVFDVVSGDEWDKSHVVHAHAVCVGLGLLDFDEVPPSSPYRDAEKMFRNKAFKPWPRGFALKGRLAELTPGDKFVKEDGTAWFVFREGTKFMNVNGPSAKKEHWCNVPGFWYCKKGSKPTARDLEGKGGPCEFAIVDGRKPDKVRKWMQETQEGKNIESDDSGFSGAAVGLPVAALGYAALQALSKRRREDEDEVDEEAAARPPRRRRRGQRDDEHEA